MSKSRDSQKSINMPSFEEIMNKETGRAGLVLFALGLTGLLIVLGLSWLLVEPDNGDSRSYKYGDFGSNVEKDFSNDFNDYYHGAATYALIGFLLIFLLGALLLWDAATGVPYRRISKFIPTQIRDPGFIKFLLILGLVILTVIIMVSGARFIGGVHSIDSGNDATDHSSPAGWGVFLVGAVLLALELYYVHENYSEFNYTKLLKFREGDYVERLQRMGTILTLLSIFGLVIFPLFTVMEVKTTYSGTSSGTSIKFKANDGLVHINAQADFKGASDYKKVDRDLAVMRASLEAGFFIGLLMLAGLYYYQNVRREKKILHLSGVMGCLFPVLGVLFIIAQVLLIYHIHDFGYEYSFGLIQKIKVEASQGTNFIPLLCTIGIVGTGYFYAREAYPVSGKLAIEWAKNKWGS